MIVSIDNILDGSEITDSNDIDVSSGGSGDLNVISDDEDGDISDNDVEEVHTLLINGKIYQMNQNEIRSFAPNVRSHSISPLNLQCT